MDESRTEGLVELFGKVAVIAIICSHWSESEWLSLLAKRAIEFPQPTSCAKSRHPSIVRFAPLILTIDHPTQTDRFDAGASEIQGYLLKASGVIFKDSTFCLKKGAEQVRDVLADKKAGHPDEPTCHYHDNPKPFKGNLDFTGLARHYAL